PSGIGQQGSPQLGQTTSAGWTDAAHRHLQSRGNGGIVGPITEGNHPQQRAASLGQLAEMTRQRGLPTAQDHPLVGTGRRLGMRMLWVQFVSRGPAITLYETPGLATSRHVQPAEYGLGVLDAIGMFDQPQPGYLHHVTGSLVLQSLCSGGVPQQ